MSTQEKVPTVSLALVEYLERIYPDRLPHPDSQLSDRQLWGQAGQAVLIRKLRKMYEAQTSEGK